MKCISINKREYEKSIVLNDFKESKQYKNLYIGDTFLMFKNWFTLYYISYETLKCAFRRVKVVPIGRREVQVEYLIIADKRNELAEIQLAGRNVAVEIMDVLKTKAPHASFVCSERLKR